ncbi:thiamine phosphate synthase [Virgibacillus xinjiangensis]|uniref:Thiamine-phosphate synthase n=1 Tax=Virgibacillus xinjiangensis TaxID=393090 RepID=A0ABV7CZL9_9BACI
MSEPIRHALRKYLIMGSQDCQRPPDEILRDAIAAGITAFQFREKGAGSLKGDKKRILGLELRDICRTHHIPFIINDDLSLAEELDADGIHVGQDDKSAEEVRRMFPNKILGLSVSNDTELAGSPLSVVDYVGAGPVFSTRTKADAKNPVGIEWIKTLRTKHPALPIVGIGGITAENAHTVIHAGADGISVISAITQAADIQSVVEKL